MDELKAALAKKRGRWYLFHAYVHQSLPAALRAGETGMSAAAERATPPGPRDGDDDEDEDDDDSWKLHFTYLTPVPAMEPVTSEDQRVMDEVLSLMYHNMHRAAVQRVSTATRAETVSRKGILVGIAGHPVASGPCATV